MIFVCIRSLETDLYLVFAFACFCWIKRYWSRLTVSGRLVDSSLKWIMRCKRQVSDVSSNTSTSSSGNGLQCKLWMLWHTFRFGSFAHFTVLLGPGHEIKLKSTIFSPSHLNEEKRTKLSQFVTFFIEIIFRSSHGRCWTHNKRMAKNVYMCVFFVEENMGVGKILCIVRISHALCSILWMKFLSND